FVAARFQRAPGTTGARESSFAPRKNSFAVRKTTLRLSRITNLAKLAASNTDLESTMNKFVRILRTALRALRRNVMRSALTTLGIVIGVAAVIAMMEIGNGSTMAIQRT